VNYPGATNNAGGGLRFSEVMYHPAVPNAAYVELYNSSGFYLELTGWRINGIGYTFPSASMIAPKSFLVLAADRAAFAGAYGAGITVFDVYPGSLKTDGETLTLFKPSPTQPGAEEIVDRISYESTAPWPAAANGAGAALQLVDSAQDHGRVLNWSDGYAWKQVSVTVSNRYTVASATNFEIRAMTAGDFYIDDVRLEVGSTPGAGTNLLVNGDFESDLSSTWSVGGNCAASTLSTEIKHLGNSSLHVVASDAAIKAPLDIYQRIIPLSVGNTYTLSFWFLPSSTITNIAAQASPFVYTNPVVAFSALRCSPGASNAVAAVLPALPLVYLNEVQPENTAGQQDNFGEREPWVELYNPGTKAVSLDGWYLTSSYNQLAQWAFPTGTVLWPGEYRLVWADGQPEQTSGTNLHTSFRLSPGAGSVALVMPVNNDLRVFDYLNYTNLAPNYSYGAYPDAQLFYRQTFVYATPGWGNNSALALPVVRINEWMADNATFMTNPVTGNPDDWFELYNPGNTTVDLTGLYLTDTNADKTQFRIPSGFSIPARSYLLVWADGTGSNAVGAADLHVNFQLSKRGESIGLYGPDGSEMDYVQFGLQTTDASEGRYPNGGPTITWLTRPTPKAANVSSLVIANVPPVLGPLTNRSLVLGQTLSFTVPATDSDVPAQDLTFSLAQDAPFGVTLSPAGQFTWTPLPGQLGSTNIFIQVTDDGVPPLSSTNSFTILVGDLPRFGVGQLTGQNGQVQFRFNAVPGKRYQIQWKQRLDDAQWNNLGDAQTATSDSLILTDPMQGGSQRFYRIEALE
jgi:hypothetical protein